MTPADFEAKVALALALMEDGQHYDAAQEIPAIIAHARRLQDLLDCETGKRAPEGWRLDTDGDWSGGGALVYRVDGGWKLGGTDTVHTYALEAIEAADKETT